MLAIDVAGLIIPSTALDPTGQPYVATIANPGDVLPDGCIRVQATYRERSWQMTFTPDATLDDVRGRVGVLIAQTDDECWLQALQGADV